MIARACSCTRVHHSFGVTRARAAAPSQAIDERLFVNHPSYIDKDAAKARYIQHALQSCGLSPLCPTHEVTPVTSSLPLAVGTIV